MSRAKFDERADDGLSAATKAQQGALSCLYCGTPTPAGTLILYGARCPQCFAEYASGPRRPGTTLPMTAAEKRDLLLSLRRIMQRPQGDPKDWAYRLKAREERGERLSPAQRSCWRAALRETHAGAEE